MKVRCVRLNDSIGQPKESSPWLTLGRTYHVLEVIQERGRWLLRIMSDEPNGVALFGLDCFDIISSAVPSAWTIRWGKQGFFELSPESWSVPGFWERYYEKEPKAVSTFDAERKRIVSADP
jgi:hypothetical protein